MKNSERVDRASRHISASPTSAYRAFSEPGSIIQWMAPAGMAAAMIANARELPNSIIVNFGVMWSARGMTPKWQMNMLENP